MKKFILLILCSGVIFAEGAKYLIIVHDPFYNAVLPLAQWKHKKGVPTKVVPLSQVGSSKDEIKSYIQNAYFNWNPRPEYVLLVGAVGYVPSSSESQGYDHYYSDFTGNALPEIAVGRFPSQNFTETQVMVEKTLAFERTPLKTPQWFIKGTTIVNRDYDASDSIYFSDARFAHQFWVQSGYTQIDSLRSDYGHNSWDVINSVNNGREFVLYRGTGVGNWYSPFDVDPTITSNGEKLPIVIGATCQTIAMSTIDEYVGEIWVRTGSPGNLKGAVAYLGTTTIITGGANLRSAFVRGFLKKLYRDSINILGKAFIGGKTQVYDSTGVMSEVRSWQVLGDPELNVWTSPIDSFYVEYPLQIPSASQNLQITVKDPVTLNPVSNSKVAILSQDSLVYSFKETDSLGRVIFSIPNISPGTLYITATKPNYLPFEETIEVVPPSNAYVNYAIYSIDDDNGDGVINPGETIQLGIGVKNFGPAISDSVYGFASIDKPLINITDSTAYFGEVLPDSVNWDSTAFGFNVSPSCTNGYAIPVDMRFYTLSGDTWSYTLYLSVGTPSLSAIADSFSDEPPFGDGNGRWQPGESVQLFIYLRNNGYGWAYNVSAELKSGNSKLIVQDSLAVYDDIAPQTSKINLSDPFVVQSDTTLAPGTVVPCTLIVRTSTDTTTVVYMLKVGVAPGTFLYSFQVPSQMPENGWITGLAFDGMGLWVADYYSPYLYKLDPLNGNYITSISVPWTGVYDLAFDFTDSTLWVHRNLSWTGYIYKIRTSDGTIIRQFQSPSGSNATGLSFDGNSLWISRYGQSVVYRVNPLNGNLQGTYALPYPGDGSRGIALDGFGPDGGTLIHTRTFADYSFVYEWNRVSHIPTGNWFSVPMDIRGVEWDPQTGDYWIAEPYYSVRGYIHKVVGFHYPRVGIEEKNIKRFGSQEVVLKTSRNIFRRTFNVQLTLPFEKKVVLSIFDITGRRVTTLFEGLLKPGNHSFKWNSNNNPSGVYFLSVKTGEQRSVYKMVKLND